MNTMQNLAALIGRVLLAWLYVDAGFSKIGGFARTVGALSSKGLPMVEVLAALTIAVELGAGLAIIAGWKTRCAAVALVVFTIIATVLFHNFWAAAPDQMRVQQLMFWKNVAVIGGLLVLAAFGPGRFALDRERR